MRAVDTNILARYYLCDDAVQARIAASVLSAGDVFVPKTVILELEWDRAFLQFILGTREIFAVGPKREMQRSHRGPISRSRSDFLGCGKQCDRGNPVANEGGNSIPLRE